MKRLAFILVAVGVLASFSSPSVAWFPHGIGQVISGACAKPSPAGQDDGCAGANQAALFKNAAFFTNARQSGQAAYAAIPTWNVAGVDYPVGQITPDVGLLDAVTNAASMGPGCAYDSGNVYIRCNTTANIQGYRFNDVGLFMAGSGNITFSNNHVTLGANTCRKFNGLEPIRTGQGTATVTNNTFDTNDACSFVAYLYKEPGDPGFVTQSTENITIASNVATVNAGTVTGNIAIGQYLDYAGRTGQVAIYGNVSPGGITTCAGAACVGTSWNVCQNATTGTYACNVTGVPNIGPVNATNGPIQPTENAAVNHALGVLPSTYKYNATLGYPTFVGDSSTADLTALYNYISLQGCCGEHNNFIVQQASGGAGTIAFKQNFNTMVWNKESQRTGTGSLDVFATSPAANTTSVSGYQITYSLAESNYNTMVSNLGYQGLKVAGTAMRMLNQGPNTGALTNNVTYTLAAGGIATVTAFNSGPGLVVGDYLGSGVTSPPKITAFITGLGGVGTYQTSNTLDTIGSRTVNTSRYGGIITQLSYIGNFVDLTGSDAAFNIDYPDVTVGATTLSGNIDMPSGGSCNSGGGTC